MKFNKYLLALIPLLMLSACSVSVDSESLTSGYKMNSWTSTDQNYQPYLFWSFEAKKDLRFVLVDPAGKEISQDYVELGMGQAKLKLAEKYTNPKQGTYKINTYTTSGLLKEEILEMKGPKLETVDCKVKYVKDKMQDTYGIQEVYITIKNKGDTPAYIYTIETDVEGYTESESETQVILPGAQREVSAKTSILGIPSTKEKVDINIKDMDGNILGICHTVIV